MSVSDVSVTLPTPEMTRPVKPVESLNPVEDPLPVEFAIPANVPTPVAKPEQPKQPPRKTAGDTKSKSEVNSKAGTRDGKATAKAASSGKVESRSASASSGNAAAANYPGKVFAKIARTRQRNAGGRGVVHVSFHVSTSGQAVRVAVSRSSGNARVDKAALAHIKRAAPFPRPPSGARTRFVIPIEFRR
ncbi:energy transducer TonB family protein [Hoeflea alexandrii]